jgi:phosphate transport system ATP-binding protein
MEDKMKKEYENFDIVSKNSTHKSKKKKKKQENRDITSNIFTDQSKKPKKERGNHDTTSKISAVQFKETRKKQENYGMTPNISAPQLKKINCFEITNLNVRYGAIHALKEINMEIEANKITAFIGPSGCGKSTLVKTLNRMNDIVDGCAVSGGVRLFGKDIYTYPDVSLLRKRVGMVFQKPNPFPMTVYDNIAFGPRTHGVKSRRNLDDVVEQSLRDAAIWDEIKDRLKKPALGLSGGQQQRLCIARALAVSPDVLLLDEPTSALDPISTGKIEELLLTLREKYSIVIVTHNMQQAARISGSTAFFLLGEVVEYSDTTHLFAAPSDKRTEDYITGRFG